eukprot:TRINITY_DN1022_c0_g1_i9.p1 TRINITY_DN1022_c0_g1~~TRINITY_DN1022_c0_g1_i9.p1  ORF type:complete len:198 (+),score=41.99 TRINITY_DN1022_c0_g1_i9:139-732(+)
MDSNKESDWDLFVIVEDHYNPLGGEVFHTKSLVDISVYNLSTWKKGIENFHPMMIFCKWLPLEFKLKEDKMMWENFQLNLPFLRASSGHERQRTICKAFHKCNKDKNITKSKKVLLHALRDCFYVIQLAKYEEIKDWKPNKLRVLAEQINKTSDMDWPVELKKWKSFLNKNMSNKIKKYIPDLPKEKLDYSHLKNLF